MRCQIELFHSQVDAQGLGLRIDSSQRGASWSHGNRRDSRWTLCRVRAWGPERKSTKGPGKGKIWPRRLSIIVFIFISLGFLYLTCLYLAFWTCGIQFLITVLMSLSADSNIQVSSGSVSFIFFLYMMGLILFSTRYFHVCCFYWMAPSVDFTILGDTFVLL